ncbi:MAG: ATP synthase F1 subunit epsilon [Actinomycetota bacterium]|nr:ATP synthase F1 subunit epsilon [Actinomycetota bacterium]
MANSFPFSLVTPERTLMRCDASMVILRTGGGDIAFMAGHAPFIGNLEPCVMTVTTSDGETKRAAVHAGFVHVANSVVRVLADVAELPDEIDVERARAAMVRAEETLMHSNDAGVEAALRRAHVRLDLASTRSGNGSR